MTTDDAFFRCICLAGLLTVVPITLYHRLQAHASGDKLDRRQEGMFILVTLRPIAAIGFLGFLVYLIHPPWMAWSSVLIPVELRWFGVGLGVVAAGLLLAALRALGTNLTDTVVTRARHTLVTRGPYRWIRHPFYVAFGLAVMANSLITANWFLGLIGLIAFALLVVRSKVEEQKLLDRFGAAYKEYRASTGRFIPQVRKGPRPDPHTPGHP